MLIDFVQRQDELFALPYYQYGLAKRSDKRFIIFYGGASSSKSYSVHQDEIISLLTETQKDVLFVRKDAADIRDSCFKLLKDLAIKYDIYSLFDWAYSGDVRQIVNSYGKKILFKGVHDPQKLKSIAGIGRIIVEEADQLTEDDFNELNRRARGIEDIKIVLIFNPIDERHWIKTRFFDNEFNNAKCSIHKFTYKDNVNRHGVSFLTPDDIRELEDLRNVNMNDYNIYVLGNWGIFKAKNPFITAFDEKKHLSGKAVFQPGREIRLSFDFNVDNTICVLGHSGVDYIHFFDSMSASDLPALLEKIYNKYKDYRFNFKITGDFSGLSRSAMLGGKTNCYVMMQSKFTLKSHNFRLIKNPEHSDSRFLCNSILGLHKEVLINPELKDLIYDLKYVECDDNEKIIKKDRSIANQKSDHLDGFRYYLNSFHYDFVKRSK